MLVYFNPFCLTKCSRRKNVQVCVPKCQLHIHELLVRVVFAFAVSWNNWLNPMVQQNGLSRLAGGDTHHRFKFLQI